MLSSKIGNRVLNKFPVWKYILLLLLFLIGLIYAIPNLYGDNPAVQVTSNAPGVIVDHKLLTTIENQLQQAKIPYLMAKQDTHFLQFSFQTDTLQQQAKHLLSSKLGDNYTVALSLTPATPNWVRVFNAEPMKYGLDLRGGVHFLLDIDVDSVIAKRVTSDMKGIGDLLRNKRIRYTGLELNRDNAITLQFRDQKNMEDAYAEVHRNYGDLTLMKDQQAGKFIFTATLSPAALTKMRQEILEQTMTAIRNRVDELGISSAAVQQQGLNRVAVDLPGVLDAGRAKQILGSTATIELHLVDDANPLNGQALPGTTLYDYEGHQLLLKNQIVLEGSSITSASSSFGQDGKPTVEIQLGGGGESYFNRITRENIGKRLAVLLIVTKSEQTMVNGKPVRVYRKVKTVVNAATIQTALGNQFQITGLEDAREASKLALILRAGALPANFYIAQERTVGPSLGKENIHKGFLSIAVGFIAVVIFMALYYQFFGIVADIALFFNLVLVVAILSALGMVLTLPGMAGIVLTVGMAVDANVLIFERIREELRNGVSVQASIHAGYDRAFSTIVDANVTTLIAAVALFSIGTGPIKGFAVTLTIGILTSMITSITGTRAIINLVYGGKPVKKLSIGI